MKTIFCEFLDSQDKDGAITIKPLGFAKNKVHKPTLPGWKDVLTEILIDKKYAKGLDGIGDYRNTPQYDEVEKAKIPDWVSKLIF